VVKLAPVLDRMSARGIPVDEAKRQELDVEFGLALERIAGECQDLFPDELRSCNPKKGFVRVPDDVQEPCNVCGGAKKITQRCDYTSKRKKRVPCDYCKATGKLLLDTPPDGFVQREFTDEVKCGCVWSKTGKTITKTILAAEECALCRNTGKRTERVTRWCKLEPFLPGSWQQKLRYIGWKLAQDIETRAKKWIDKGFQPERARAKAEGLTEWYVPFDHKTGKPTTEADELARLAKKTGDALLPKCLEFTEIQRARGTYVQGWRPGPDGRVHPNFGFKPATGQLSSDSPNAQNFPAHGELAERMKMMIVGSEG
jgi:hypothetical protein